MGTSPAVIGWDAQGNPINSSAPAQATGAGAPIGWDAQGNPIHAVPTPQLDLSNPLRQGTYQMKDASGKVVGVPYGEVNQAATKFGYGFADDQNRFRYAKDAAADPHGNTYGSSFTPTLQEQTPEGHRQAVYAREDAASPVGQVAIGVGKAGGTITKPVGDLASVVGEAAGVPTDQDETDYITARGGLQTTGKVGGLLAAAAPAAIEAPLATAGALATGSVSGVVGKTVGTHLGLTDKQSDLLADLFAIAGGSVGGVGGGKLQPKLSGMLGGEASETPGLIKQVMKGEDVNQPAAQSAVRGAVQTSADNLGTASEDLNANIKAKPIAQNGSTILDDHLSKLQKMEQTAYQKLDDVAGFDLKAEKAQLSNDNYKLSQLGNTDADINTRGNLIEAINDSTDRIAQAESKLQAAGIDPKAADTIHQQRMAGVDYKKVLVRSTNPDGSVDVDRLLAQSNNLRYSKYGDRLQQFLGSKDAADAYLGQLQKAQQLGVHALKAQKVAQMVAKWIGSGLGVGAGVGVAHHLLSE